MSYTFGAGTGDDITTGMAFTAGADNGTCLVAGWWYPTTLTATRGYWSCGDIFGAEIDTTTSEIRMRTDNTTDGQWLTSGAGITTNKWWFIAWLAATENTTVAGAWRVWVGDAENHPTEVTVTNPTPRSGNYTGNSNFYLGNKGVGTLAFQGDIGWGCLIGTGTVGQNNPFNIANSGAIDTWETEATLRRWVEPLYFGQPRLDMMPSHSLATFSITHLDLTVTNGYKTQWSHSINPANAVPTINGASYSNNQPPVRPPFDWPNAIPKRR